MNWLDIVLVFIFVLTLYNGFRQGLLRQVVGLTSFFIALFLALYWSSDVRILLERYLNMDELLHSLVENGAVSFWIVEAVLNIIIFLVIFSIISLLLHLITKKLSVINKVPVVGPINAFLGVFIGAVKGILIIFLIVGLLSLIEVEFWQNTLESSAVVALSSHYMSLLFHALVDYIMESLTDIV